MKQWKTLTYFIILNVIISACTTVAVLLIWDYTHPTGSQSVSQLSAPAITASNLNEATAAVMTAASQAQANSPTSTPEPEIPQNVEAYQVEFGDTLGLIADKFDASIEELVKLNQLSDANSLSVGMVIYIPKSSSDPLPTLTPQPSRTTAPPAGSGTPAVALPVAGVIINSVIGVGEIAMEHVFISRTGSGQLSMIGWKIEDEDGNAYVFPQLVLFESGAVNVWTTPGTPTMVDLYWGQQNPVWERGEKVTLIDDKGKERAIYTIP
jgi:LysM repeat protein